MKDSPRNIIRSYLLELFETLEIEFSEGWPNVAPSIYQQIEQSLVSHVGELCHYAIGKKHQLSILVYGEFVRNLFWLDWNLPNEIHGGDSETEELLKGRPLGIFEPFDQLFCTAESTQRRVQRILQDVDMKNGRVLCLGDDDLCSIVLNSQFEGEIHVIDLDERILNFIAERAPEVELHRIDLQKDGLPKRFYEYFDLVLLDPPWDKFGAWFFLEKAIYCLNRNLSSRIYLSFCPVYMEYDERAMHQFYMRLAQFGLGFESIEPCFNIYSLGSENNPELRQKLLEYEIPTKKELPSLELLRQLPYVHSNLYTIKPLYKTHQKSWKRHWFKAIHSE